MTAPDAATRERMIAECMRVGMDREAASVLTDIGKHAFDEAMAAAQRVVQTAPDDLQLPAFASVLASFATIMREKLPAHWAAFSAMDTSSYVASVITLPDRGQQ